MAMNLDALLRIKAQVSGQETVRAFSGSLKGLDSAAKISTADLGRMNIAINRMAREAGNTTVGVKQHIAALQNLRDRVDIGGKAYNRLGAEIDQLKGKLRGLDNEAKKTGSTLKDELIGGLAAVGAGQAIKGIVQGAAEFDQAVRTAAAIASSGGGDFQGAFTQLKTEIESVASAAAGTPTEVANLAVALQRAGFSVTETAQSLRGIVAGAEATSISFEEMGSITADTLRQFGLDTTQTMRVVDLLTDASNSANQKVQDVGEAMKYAAPIAKNLGVSVEDTAATIALLAEAGIRGSDAGTALRTGLTRLQIAAGGADSEVADLTRGNKQLTEAMSVLGSKILDTEGKLKPLDQVILGLKAGMDGLSATDQAVLAKALFGMEAGSKFVALVNQSGDRIRAMFGDMRDAGGEAEETQKKMQGFAYSMEVLNGNVQNVSNSIGNQFMAAMKPAVDIMNKMLSAANDLPDPTKEFAAQLAAVGLAAGAVTLALRTLIPLLRTFVALMGALKIGGLLAAGPWFALAAGIAAVAVALNNAANAQQAFDRTMATGSLGDVRKQVMKLQEQVAADQDALDRMEAGSREQVFAQARLDARKAALEQARAAYRQRLNQPAAPKAAAATAPPVPMGATPPESSSRGAGKSEADKAAEAAKKQAEELKRSYESGIQLGTQLQRRLLLLDAATDRERKLLQIGFDHEDRLKQINELMNAQQRINLKQLSDEQKRLELRELDLEYLRGQLSIFERIAGIDFSKTAELGKRAFAGAGGAFDLSLPDLRVSPAEQQMAKYREELAALTNPINMAVTGADAIGNAFGQAFQDIATGAKSTQEALADVFKGIGEAFIQMATQIIAKQLAMIAFQTILKALGGGGGGFSFSGAGPAALPGGAGFAQGFSMPALLPGRANGGPVTSGSPYLVGERGPELFVPSSSGSVMSNADTRAALAEQSAARSTNDTRAMLEQQTAARQANATGMALQQKPIDVRYESSVINNVEYVTADQHRKGLAQAAERGRALTLAALQNSTRTRKKVGI